MAISAFPSSIVLIASTNATRDAEDRAAYSQLHYTILEILVEQGKGGEGAASVQPRYLTHLTESLLARWSLCHCHHAQAGGWEVPDGRCEPGPGQVRADPPGAGWPQDGRQGPVGAGGTVAT